MVPANSHRISPVPRYSGYLTHYQSYVYETFTLYGWSFQGHSTSIDNNYWGPTTPIARKLWVWANPLSLTTTNGIIIIFSSSRYLDVSVPWVAHPLGSTGLQPDGFSHSDISGSKVVCTSPKLFAAYHVLRHLREPRHPPFALICFLIFN